MAWTPPNTFVNGTIADATDVNENFTDVATYSEEVAAAYAGRWSTVRRVDGYLPTTAITLMLATTSAGSAGAAASTAHPGAFGWVCEPGDYTVPGYATPQLRLRGTIFTNLVAPGVDITFDMRPVTGYAGSSGNQAIINTLGSVVADSAFTMPSVSTQNGDAFDVPAAGVYVVTATSSGTVAAGSLSQAIVEIQARVG